MLASRVGGIPEILTGPLGRFLFEPEDAAGLAELLVGLIHWRDKEPELAELCRARVLDQFTLAQTVDGLEASFRSAR